MASIKKSLSKKITNGKSEVFLRLSVRRGEVYRIKTGVYVSPARFKAGAIIYPRANQREVAELRIADDALTDIERLLIDYVASAKRVSSDRLKDIVDAYHHPELCMEGTQSPQSFLDIYQSFLAHRDISEHRCAQYYTLARALHRYEAHRRIIREPDFALDIDTLTSADIYDFEDFFKNEWRIYKKYPALYRDYPPALRPQHKKPAPPQKRGNNAIVDKLKCLRSFFKWCIDEGLTDNDPFSHYAIKRERYGTPYYLTIEERDRLADFDLTGRPALAVQRDIFVFQCLIGCRVSDLLRLTSANVVGGYVEYVARKTSKERADIIRVPLASRARAIIDKYAGSTRLLPFISAQRYNDAIKEMCRLAGIDRIVTVINPTTGKDERRPIYEIASSHLARRTFIGNLYKRVKDPNLVGSLSGHKEGSKAFARYRDIDDDIKRELIDLIE